MYPEEYITAVVYIMTGLIGLCVGSFLNVVIYRLPNGMSIATPPSHCTTCGYQLKWYDNIPVISYLFLGGKCRKCKEHISVRYTVVELANALLWLMCLNRFGFDGWKQIICSSTSAIASSLCLCVAFIDLEHQIIFDRFHVMLGALGVVFIFGDDFAVWWSHIAGAVFAGLVFFIIGTVVSKRVGREALGGGDVKLAFVSGLFLGWERFILMMLIASVSSLILIFSKGKDRDKQKEYPFGPFLSVGFIISLLYGANIILSYIHFFEME